MLARRRWSMKRLLVALTVFCISVLAADVAGTWKGTAETDNGTIERTFIFKVEGTKLTGETTSSLMGKSTIENGKIEGNNLSFNITGKFQDNEVRLNYTGEVKGDEMLLKVEIPNGPVVEYKAKKIS
jgi:hypothetical protein